MMPAKNKMQAEALFFEGLDALTAGKPDRAAGLFRQALALDPEHSEARHGLLRALEDAGQLDEALALAQDLIASSPDDALAYTRLSILYQKMGRVPEAEAAATKAKLLDWKRQLQEPKETE